MKRILIYTLPALIGCGIFYLMMAFYSLSFNPATWKDGARGATLFIWVIIWTVGVLNGIFEDDRRKDH